MPDFRALFESSPNAYMVIDRDLRYVTANRAYLEATGTRIEDLVGRRIFDVFPDDPDSEAVRRVRASFARVLASGHTDVLPCVPYRLAAIVDGRPVFRERWWSATHTPIRGGEGTVDYLLQHVVDVTPLRREGTPGDDGLLPPLVAAGVLGRAREVQAANESLSVEIQHLRTLVAQAPGFMCVLRGPRHIVELTNDAYARFLGERPLIGQPIADAVPEMRAQGFADMLDRVFATGVPFVGRGVRAMMTRVAGSEPAEVVLDFACQPVRDSEGTTVGIFVEGHDITAQKRLEQELQALLARERAARGEAEAAMDELACTRDALQQRVEFDTRMLGIVSHDLRNPISAINVATALLLERGHLDEQQVRVVTRIMSSGERASRLVRDFLDFTRTRVSGQIPVRRVPSNVREIARRAFDELRLTYADRIATLTHEGEVDAVIDPDRMEQLIGNLVGNAFQYSPADSTVDVHTRGTTDEVQIEVRNQGEPIPPERVARLFEPFQRGASAGSSTGSVGLGLFISRQIVLAHGGTIDVDSNVSETVFRVTLPRGIAQPST